MEATEIVELVEDVWIYIFRFLTLPEKAKLSQISKQLRDLLDNPSVWTTIEYNLTKLQNKCHETFFGKFLFECSALVDLNLTVDCLLLVDFTPSDLMERIFSIQTLRRLKVNNSAPQDAHEDLSFSVTKQPLCQGLQLLNLEEFLPIANADAEALILSGLPNLEELYLHEIYRGESLSGLTKMQRLRIDARFELKRIVDLLPNLKFVICKQLKSTNNAFTSYVTKYRDTWIVHRKVFERLFDLTLDQVKIVAPLITPHTHGKPYLTYLMEQMAYNDDILEYLVQEVGLDVNGRDFPEYPYRPSCVRAKTRSQVKSTFAYPIVPALIQSSPQKAMKLVELGAKLEQDGKSLLHYVVLLPLLLKLLESGANPNLPIDDISTPTFIKLISQHPDSSELIQALISAGIDINGKDPEKNRTLLEITLSQGKLISTQALLAAGAEITSPCITPLIGKLPNTFVEMLKSKRISYEKITMNDAVVAIYEGLASHMSEYFEHSKDVRDENGLSLLHRVVLITTDKQKKRPQIKGFNRPQFTNYLLNKAPKPSFVRKPSQYDCSREVITYSDPFAVQQSKLAPQSDSSAISTNHPSSSRFSFSDSVPPFSFSEPENKSKTTPSHTSTLNSSTGFSFSGTQLEPPSVSSTTKTESASSSGFDFASMPLELPSFSSTAKPTDNNNTSPMIPASTTSFSFSSTPLELPSINDTSSKTATPAATNGFNFTSTPSQLPLLGNTYTESNASTSNANSSSGFNFSSLQPLTDSPSTTSPDAVNFKLFNGIRFSFNKTLPGTIQTPINTNVIMPLPPLANGAPLAFNLNSSTTARGTLLWKDNFDSLIELLKIDYNIRTSAGETPLLLACKGRVEKQAKLKYVQSLLTHGADPHTGDHHGWTPLHAACYTSDWIVTFELLKNGANINAQDSLGITPLMAALYGFKHDRKFRCNKFEQHFSQVVNEYPVDFSLTEKTTKRTLLHLLCCVAGPDIVVPFVKNTNINARDASGFTPLHYAIMFANDQLIEPLIKCGADVNAQTTSLKLTPLMLFLSMFLQSPYGSSLESYNTLLGSELRSIKLDPPSSYYYMQIPEYINPPWHSIESHHPMASAAAKCGVVIDMLLPKTDLTLKDVRNNNVLHMLATCDAYFNEYLAKFPQLDQLKIQLNDDNLAPNIQTPIFSYKQQLKEAETRTDSLVVCLKKILEGAKLALERKLDLQFDELLARSSTNVDADRDAHGNTALHIACQFFHLGALDSRHGKLDNESEARVFCCYAFKLLDEGADPTIKNNKGETPIDYVPDLMEYYATIYPSLQ